MRKNASGKYPNCPSGIKAAMNSVPDGEQYEHMIDWDDNGNEQQNEMQALYALALTAGEKPEVFTYEQIERINYQLAVHNIGNRTLSSTVENVNTGEYL